MKKSVIVLIISIVFLIISMLLVITKRFNKYTITNEMTSDYITTNYNIDMFDEVNKNKIDLNVKAKYIGIDKIVEDPVITLSVICNYEYEDADELYDNELSDVIILQKNNDLYEGNVHFEVDRDSIESYSCYYLVSDVSGKYKSKK